MRLETITYEDYNGENRTEKFYFNLTEAEMTTLEVSESGGFAANVADMAEKEDRKRIAETIKEFILASYGEKSVDGRFFQKKRDGHLLRDDFEQTPAFSVLFMNLLQDAAAASDFINGVVPASVAKRMNSLTEGEASVTTIAK